MLLGSGRDTHRLLYRGQISYAPSSTAFCTTVSSLSPLGKHWHTVTFAPGSPRLGDFPSTRSHSPPSSPRSTVQG